MNDNQLAPVLLRMSPTYPFPRKGRFDIIPSICSPGQLAGAKMLL